MKDSLAILATLAASASAALEPVTVKGNAFFAGNERFYMRGIDYQPGGASDATDPLANPSTCKRDIPYFKELGLNTIRVYTVDNSKNHDECMKALDDAGIYLALDVNTPLYSLNREDPEGSYNDVYLQSVFATMEMFAEYDNTLLFFSGNEVINAPNNTNCAPYVKATTRDMKSYIAARGLRNVPVGYSAADVDDNRFEMASYMNCGTDDQRSDFFAFNDYSWCAPSSFTKSGWDQKVKQYSQYSIPLFLSEFGCITNTRDFGELEALYSSQMSSVYSGGLVYEYSEEGSGYGLVNLNGNTVKELPDFAALKSSLQENTISGDGGYKQNLSPSKCPPSSNTWEVDDFSGADLPAIPDGAVKYLNDGAGKGPGLNGDGSQWATDGASDSTASPGSGEGSSASSSSSSSSSNGAGALTLPSLLWPSIVGCSAYLLVAAF